MHMSTVIAIGVTLALTPPIAMFVEHHFKKKRRRKILDELTKGERTTLQLRDVAGPLVYGDLHEMEDEGVVERRLRAGGPERGYREVSVYSLKDV